MISARSTLAGHIRALLAGVIFLAASLPLLADDTATAYANWVKPWTERPITSPALNGAGLKLVVSCVRGETNAAAVKAMSPVERLDLAYHIRVSATELATNGGFRSYLVNNTTAKTSTTAWLTPNELWQVDQLLSILPDDHGQLPPPGMRIVFQFLADGQWHVHVYDGNDLPAEAHSILSLLAKPYGKLF